MSLITRLHYCLRYLSHCYSVIRYVPIQFGAQLYSKKPYLKNNILVIETTLPTYLEGSCASLYTRLATKGLFEILTEGLYKSHNITDGLCKRGL